MTGEHLTEADALRSSAFRIVMPDPLPADYREPASDIHDRFYFGGRERTLVRQDSSIAPGGAFLVEQAFACGSRRMLRFVYREAGEDRFVVERAVIRHEGHIQRVHEIGMAFVSEVLSPALEPAEWTASDFESRDPFGRDDADRSTALQGPLQAPLLVHHTPEWFVYRGRSPIEIAALGYGTAWCTAYPGRPPSWAEYAKGDLYVLHGRGNKKRRRTKYQVHIDQFGAVECARHDNEHLGLGRLVQRHPELAEWVHSIRYGNLARSRRRTAERAAGLINDILNGEGS